MFDRITSDPAILGGKPIVKGTRISVELILEWMDSGASRDEIIRLYPHLSAEDIEQALAFAASAMETVVRNVRDIDTADREALEHVVGLELHENQQLIIQVVSAASPGPQQAGGGLPEWCNVYEGLTDAEIDDIEMSIVRRPRCVRSTRTARPGRTSRRPSLPPRSRPRRNGWGRHQGDHGQCRPASPVAAAASWIFLCHVGW